MKHFGTEAVSNIIITIGRSNSYSHPLVVVNYKLREVELVDGNAAVEVLQSRDVLHLPFHSRRTECGEVPHQYLSHINTCHTWREVPHQYLSHINNCHTSIPVTHGEVPHQYLSHINTCHTSIPVTTWRSATSIPVTNQYLSHMEKYHINTCKSYVFI